MPDKAPQYKNRKSAQEAHEAIRPSYVELIPEEIRSSDRRPVQALPPDLAPLRGLADETGRLGCHFVDIAAGDLRPARQWLDLKFQASFQVYEEAKDEDAAMKSTPTMRTRTVSLPALEKDQDLKLNELLPKQHFTQPPPRYTEATLVKALEENGIGRPSTYASILNTIVDRKYTELEQRRFTPTNRGFAVNDKLVQHFGNIVNVGFTAGVEEQLDEVEEGKRGWTDVLQKFYDPFHEGVERAKTEMERVGPSETDIPCLKCGTLLLHRDGKFGEFYSCPYEECKPSQHWR